MNKHCVFGMCWAIIIFSIGFILIAIYGLAIERKLAFLIVLIFVFITVFFDKKIHKKHGFSEKPKRTISLGLGVGKG